MDPCTDSSHSELELLHDGGSLILTAPIGTPNIRIPAVHPLVNWIRDRRKITHQKDSSLGKATTHACAEIAHTAEQLDVSSESLDASLLALCVVSGDEILGHFRWPPSPGAVARSEAVLLVPEILAMRRGPADGSAVAVVARMAMVVRRVLVSCMVQMR